MKKFGLIAMLFLTFTSFVYLNAQWAKTYGGSLYDSVNSIQQTSDGGYVVVGSTRSFDAGKTDFWVLKLNSFGNIEWQFTYGSEDSERAYSIQQTSDSGYIIAGSTDYRRSEETAYWILKLYSTGDIEWQRAYGGRMHSIASSIQQTIDGGYIVAGPYRFMGAFSKFLVLKLSSTGDVEWGRTYEIDPHRGSGMSCSIQQTSDGGYILAGYSSLYNVGWVLKLSSTGDIEWQRTYGIISQYSYKYNSKIQQTSDGGYILAGWACYFDERSDDLLILKLSSTGDIEWQRSYGGNGDDRASSIQQTSNGGYIVAGSTESFGAGDYDILVLKLDSAGDIEWERVYGGSDYDSASSIQQTSDGGYIVAGSTKSFGAGDYDILVLKLDSAGDIVPTCELIGSSNVTISVAYISPQDINISPQDINPPPDDTSITPHDSDATVNLLCAREFNLTISNTTGGTTDPAPGICTYDTGTEVTIEAIANSGYEFSGWSGDASGTDNPITITMDSDKSITANFQKKSLCFIATAAYDSPLHPHVNILRDFRDTYLMPNKIGRKLVGLYNKYSPFVANLIAKNKALKVIIRNQLIPLVAFSYSMVHFGPIITALILVFIFLFPIFFLLYVRRKLRWTNALSIKRPIQFPYNI